MQIRHSWFGMLHNTSRSGKGPTCLGHEVGGRALEEASKVYIRVGIVEFRIICQYHYICLSQDSMLVIIGLGNQIYIHKAYANIV